MKSGGLFSVHRYPSRAATSWSHPDYNRAGQAIIHWPAKVSENWNKLNVRYSEEHKREVATLIFKSAPSELDAQLVANHRPATGKARWPFAAAHAQGRFDLSSAFWVQGIKVFRVGGRLNGAEIAPTEL